ncbi:cysteine--tRNA ligase [Desulfonema magnum]|uniref:Cysteine--tRNA ligase n=1 Tax=Desulfonema magnum TaxID=45655 RepID=A0A975GRN4_9BACT|nr:cysteine--tRNA ligase [Desulfonema magnum]QTA91110.1 Cysteine--tRNA ligase [Desulfonema magnum]
MSYSILDAIGNTPLVEIRKLNPNPKVRILAKLEYVNPGGSIKDRAALFMIEAGEKSGELTPDKTVIEATSGNTGIGLALICAVKGYKLLLAMSEAASLERQQILKARGADILLTPGHLGTDGAIEEVYRLARENPETYFMTDQYNNEANCQAHICGTAKEIWEQTHGKVSAVVATVGTTGTLMGISKGLKKYNPDIRIIGAEPYLGHKIQGLKNLKESYCPEIYDKDCLDRKVNIEDEEAFEMARQLAKKEGLFVGMSSGAAMAIAQREAREMAEGIIVVIFPDSGERYLSTPLFTVRDKADLKLFNTLSRTKEPFEPITPGKVSMYSCGPTAYARLHPGEWRRFVFSDLLCRYLEFRGYSVNHIMNITDLDDKTITGSEKQGLELSEFTKKHIESFKEDLVVLGIEPAAKYPRASEHVEDMTALAEKLMKKGFAYEKLRSLYFDISRFGEYGQLSGIDINKIKLGATVDLDEYEKDNPRDFTLFKRSRLSELKRGIYVKTEWGNVRPSWHIQCAAISMKYLGESFDIHTSSRELMFPHHENEIAIAGALTGKPLARYWIHCDRVLVDGKKVDENGTRMTLDEVRDKGYSGKDIRYWLLSGHYRKPLIFSEDRLDFARHSLKRLNTCVHALLNIKQGDSYPELDQLLYDIKQGFVQAMDDDLNISAAMASIFRHIKKINTLLLEKKISPDDAFKITDVFRSIDSVLNMFDFGDELSAPEIQTLIKEREKARAAKNWELADKIREQLISRGVTIRDGKSE